MAEAWLLNRGTIIDGTGKQAYLGRVLVSDDRVIQVGSFAKPEDIGLSTAAVSG